MLEFKGKQAALSLIESYGFRQSEFCLVGGAVFAVHGVRENHDVDFAVNPGAFQRVLHDTGPMAQLKRHRNIILISEDSDIHIGRFQNIGISDEMLLEDPQFHRVIDGIKVCRLEVELVDRIFEKYPDRRKDVELIRQQLASIPNLDWGLVLDIMLLCQDYRLSHPSAQVKSGFMPHPRPAKKLRPLARILRRTARLIGIVKG